MLMLSLHGSRGLPPLRLHSTVPLGYRFRALRLFVFVSTARPDCMRNAAREPFDSLIGKDIFVRLVPKYERFSVSLID